MASEERHEASDQIRHALMDSVENLLDVDQVLVDLDAFVTVVFNDNGSIGLFKCCKFTVYTADESEAMNSENTDEFAIAIQCR